MDESEDDFEEWGEFPAEVELDCPSGLTFAAFLWNVLTLIAEIFTAFAKLCYSMRADVAIHSANKTARKTFASSVEAGIESLG